MKKRVCYLWAAAVLIMSVLVVFPAGKAEAKSLSGEYYVYAEKGNKIKVTKKTISLKCTLRKGYDYAPSYCQKVNRKIKLTKKASFKVARSYEDDYKKVSAKKMNKYLKKNTYYCLWFKVKNGKIKTVYLDLDE